MIAHVSAFLVGPYSLKTCRWQSNNGFHPLGCRKSLSGVARPSSRYVLSRPRRNGGRRIFGSKVSVATIEILTFHVFATRPLSANKSIGLATELDTVNRRRWRHTYVGGRAGAAMGFVDTTYSEQLDCQGHGRYGPEELQATARERFRWL